MARNPKTIARARALRSAMPSAEARLWKMLRSRRFEHFKFRRQHAIGPYAVDFACVTQRLVVEVDGPSHGLDEQAVFDARRTAFLEAAGWRVLRLANGEVEADESAVIRKLLDALNA